MPIRIRMATSADMPGLVGFIESHWAADHLFVHRPEVFKWQHAEPSGQINFVLAESVEEDDTSPAEPVGVLGYIPLGHFDAQLGETDVMLALWKVRDGAPPGLGLRLLKFLQASCQPRTIAAIGISEIAKSIYEVLRYDVELMFHGALFNPNRRETVAIATGTPEYAFDPLDDDGSVELVPIDLDLADEMRSVIDRLARNGTPTKSWSYLERRYLRHPWYRYELRLVLDRGQPSAVVVWRTVHALRSTVLRIVDVIGSVEWMSSGGAALRREVVAADAEYIDLMYAGSFDALAQGFVSPADHEGLVLPGYFAPFEQRNVPIWAAWKVLGDRPTTVRFFRADSDQDRPNRPDEVDAAASV